MIHRLSSNSSPFIGRGISGTIDVLGIANAAATVTVNGQSASRKGEYFQSAPAYTNTSAALYPFVTNTAILSGNTNTVTGQVFIAKTPETFTYDADGNQTSDGRWTNRWDGENRLITMESLASAPSGSSNRLTFTYDFMGRRVSKQVETWTNSAYSTIVSNKFVYDGWNLVAELNGTNNSAIRTYLWGMDLSGSMQGAGGVGGLLAVKDTVNATHFAAYDGNGNVTGLFSAADGTTSAVYEYDPFGNLLRATGPMAKVSPFRFSTKYQDDETDWSYYGYRFYNAGMGRWLNRDPIGERGGINLFAISKNRLVVDALGLMESSGGFEFPTQIPPWRPKTANGPTTLPTGVPAVGMDLGENGNLAVTIFRASIHVTDVGADCSICYLKSATYSYTVNVFYNSNLRNPVAAVPFTDIMAHEAIHVATDQRWAEKALPAEIAILKGQYYTRWFGLHWTRQRCLDKIQKEADKAADRVEVASGYLSDTMHSIVGAYDTTWTPANIPMYYGWLWDWIDRQYAPPPPLPSPIITSY